MDLKSFRRLRNITETQGGTRLTLIAILPSQHVDDLIGYYRTEAGTAYAAVGSDSPPNPQRLGTTGYGDAIDNVAAQRGTTAEALREEWERFLDAAHEQSTAAKIADATAEVESRIAKIREADAEGDLPVDPRRSEGDVGAIKSNAQRYVEWNLATLWEDYRDSGVDPVEAAILTVDSARSRLIREAQHAPRSSDWLALPRWAAHVEALGAAAESGSYEMRFAASLHYLIRAAR